MTSIPNEAIRDVSERIGRRYAHLHQLLRDELQAQAWDEGATVAWEASGEGWNGEYPGEPFANNDIPNPYRSKS